MNLQAKTLNFPDNEKEITKTVEQWNSLNVSSAYILSSQLTKAHQTLLSKFRGELWVIIQTLLQNDTNFPLAITQEGKEAIGEGDGQWLKMLCPRGKNLSGITIAEWQANQIDEIITATSPTGISLDFIRHFAFWERAHTEEEINSIPQSCFCPECIQEFTKKYQITIPENLNKTREISEWILQNDSNKWNEFTIETITSLVTFFYKRTKEKHPNIMLNLHLVPWNQNEYNGAVSKITGQDITRLTPYLHQVSPMCYSPMLNKPATWISNYIEELKLDTALPIFPAVQICPMYGTKPLTDMEFREILHSTEKADGVVLWPWERLTESQIQTCSELKSRETTSYTPDT